MILFDEYCPSNYFCVISVGEDIDRSSLIGFGSAIKVGIKNTDIIYISSVVMEL